MKLTEELLLRYADGLLDAEQAAKVRELLKSDDVATERLRLIQSSGQALREEAASPLAEGPTSELMRRILGDGPDAVHAADEKPRLAQPGPLPARHVKWPHARWIAAAIAGLVLGLGAGYLAAVTSDSRQSLRTADQPVWLVRVVDYHTLYDRETVAPSRATPAKITHFEQRFSRALGRRVHIPDLSAHRLQFRRGQILKFEGDPIIQLAYLPQGAGRPVALCLKRTRRADADPAYTEIRGMGVMRWRRNGVDYALIGYLAESALRAGAVSAIQSMTQSERS